MQDDVKIAWAAGILEGEGSFLLVKHKRFDYIESRISCEMKDADVIEELLNIFNVGHIYKRKNTELQSWIVSRRGDVLKVLLAIQPYMKARRSIRINEMINYLKEIKHALAVNAG